jgi:RNA polymerase sigma factor (sigma-70 family)
MSGSGEFPVTTWGVLRSLEPGTEGYRRKMEELARRYWGAIRHYARAAWAQDDHDADDIAQEFFVWLLKGDVLEKYAAERGSFRNYLKGLLRNFARNYRRAERRRLKREGSARLERGPDVADAPDEAEAAFDRQFIAEATKRALAALKKSLAHGPKAIQWKLLDEYDLVPVDERPTYGELASRHGVPETTVRNNLHRARSLLREEIRRELAETVGTFRELEEEWRHLVGE